MSTQCRVIKGFSAQKEYNESYAFREIKLPLVNYCGLEGAKTPGGKATLGLSIGTHRKGSEGWSESSDCGHGKAGKGSAEEGQRDGYEGSS